MMEIEYIAFMAVWPAVVILYAILSRHSSDGLDP